MDTNDFIAKFSFLPETTMNVGVEQECFIADCGGAIVPAALELLQSVRTLNCEPELFGYELSACQLETRTQPVLVSAIRKELIRVNGHRDALLSQNGYRAHFDEVGPEHMPLDVYPDPSGRYQRITQCISKESLLAACRVIGTHVHIGMPDLETALRVYNHVIKHLDVLCERGNGSFGERLAIYKQMAPDYRPQRYDNMEDYYHYALEHGFADDPRRCWTLIRITIHGTIEFRMFGATHSSSRVASWARICHEVCAEAMSS